MKISIQMELTAENIDRLKLLLAEPAAEVKTEEPAKETAEEPKPAKAPAKKKAKPAEETAEAEETAKAITKADIRAKALSFSKSGRSDKLAEIFQKFGASKLSEINEEDYPDLMRELVNADV